MVIIVAARRRTRFVVVGQVHRAVYIATDGGRVCRPLLLVDPATGLRRVVVTVVTLLVTVASRRVRKQTPSSRS